LPIEDGEIYVSLTAGRPSAKDPLGSDTLRRWIIATNIRLRLISTKTMLGHLMSVAQGDKTVTRRVSPTFKAKLQKIHFILSAVVTKLLILRKKYFPMIEIKDQKQIGIEKTCFENM
jgi:hypothetical protein